MVIENMPIEKSSSSYFSDLNTVSTFSHSNVVVEGTNLLLSGTSVQYSWDKAIKLMNGDEIGFLRSSGIDGSGNGVFATFIESDTQSPQTLHQINQKTSGSQRLLDVAELPGNNIVTLYSSSLSGSYYEYFLRYFDSDLKPLGDAILVDTVYSHVEGALSVNSSSVIVVYKNWERYSNDRDDGGIYAKLYDHSGNEQTTAVQIFQDNDHSKPKILTAQNDQFIILAYDYETPYRKIVSAKLDSDLSIQESEQVNLNDISTESTDGLEVIKLSNDDILVTYNGSRYGAYARIYDESFEPLTISFELEGNHIVLKEVFEDSNSNLMFATDRNFYVLDPEGTTVASLDIDYTLDSAGWYDHLTWYKSDPSRVKLLYSGSVYSVDLNFVPDGSVLIDGNIEEYSLLSIIDTLSDEDGKGETTYSLYADDTLLTSDFELGYTLTDAEIGKTLKLVAEYVDGNGTTETITYTADTTVQNVNDAPEGSILISGQMTEGKNLSVLSTLTDKDGLGDFTYSWFRDETKIADEANSFYKLKQDDVGTVISAKVEYVDGYGASETVSYVATEAVANLNNLPTGELKIIGSETQGETLSISNTIADIDGVGEFRIKWYRDDVLVIDGEETYQLTQADVGTKISVVASYEDAFGNSHNVTSAATGSIANINDDPIDPANSLSILGSAEEGQYLNAVNTIVDPDGYSDVTYQWLRQGKVISGATSSEYQLTQEDVGSNISVQVSYQDAYGHDEVVSSPATDAISNTNNTPTGAYLLTGSASVGKLLIADFDIIDADGVGTKAYTWYLDDQKLEGENGQSILLTDEMLGKSIKAVINYTDDFGTAEEITSIKSDPVAIENSDPIGAAEVIGKDVEGELLNSDVQITDADGLGAFSYQWFRDNSPLIGETNSTYLVDRQDVGASIMFSVNYTDGRGTTESFFSTPTVISAAKNTSPTGEIRFVGDFSQNETITAEHTIEDADGLGTFNYRWFADSAQIEAQDQKTLALTQDLVGSKISLEISYTDQLGFEEKIWSAKSSLVKEVNDAPVIETISTQTASENAYWSYQIKASDPDPNDDLNYELTSDFSWLELNETSGLLFGIPTYVGQESSSGDVQITVTDKEGLSATKSFTLDVSNLPASERDLSLNDPIGLAEYKHKGEEIDIVGKGNSVTFGDDGSQTINARANSSLQFLVGLEGGDKYEITSNDSVAVIADFGGTGSDSIYASGIDLASSYTAIMTVDSNHLVVGNLLTSQEFWVPNWKDDRFKIENYNFGGTNYTHASLVNTFSSLPNYLGNLSFADLQALTGSEVYNKTLMENTLAFYGKYIANTKPEILADASYNSKVGFAVSGTFSIDDEAVSTIDLSILSKPDWLDVDLDNLTFTGTPGRKEIGEHNLILKAVDEFGAQDFKTIPIKVTSANSALVGYPKLKFDKDSLIVDLHKSELSDADGVSKQKSYWEISRKTGSKITIEDVDELNLSPVDFSLSNPLADVFILGGEKALKGAQLKIDSYVDDLAAFTKTNASGQFALDTVPSGPVKISLAPDEIELSSRVEVEDTLGNTETKYADKLILNSLEETVNLSDVLASLKHIIGLKSVSGASFTQGDVNNDGSINLSDVLGMLKHIIGLKELPAAQVVSESYFRSKHIDFNASLNSSDQTKIDMSLDLNALAEQYGKDLLSYKVELSSQRDTEIEAAFETISETDFLVVQNPASLSMSLTANLEQVTNLRDVGIFQFATATLDQDSFDIADLKIDVEVLLEGSEQVINESFLYYFENGEHFDGAIDLTQGMQNLVIYAPGDLDGTLDDYQGYELV